LALALEVFALHFDLEGKVLVNITGSFGQ